MKAHIIKWIEGHTIATLFTGLLFAVFGIGMCLVQFVQYAGWPIFIGIFLLIAAVKYGKSLDRVISSLWDQ